MATMAADKEIMKAIETLRLDRPGRVYAIVARVQTIDPPTRGVLAAALTELAATYREEAELWAKSGAKGWKGSEAENYLIAQAIDSVAAQLDNAGGGAALSVSQTEPATTHKRLDDLVSAAVAEGRGMLKLNDLPTTSAEIDGIDVTAYLKGEVDTLLGLAEALVPGSVTDGTVHLEPVELIDNGDGSLTNANAVDVTVNTGSGVRTLAPGDTITVGEHDTATILPKTWESETMTPDGHRPPGLAPTLGQPGDNSGGGYSHDYVPPGGRRLSYADLLQPVPAASLPPHLSHSQGDTIGDCAAKYRMQRVDQLPQIPQWANIGGTAFHAAVEAIERTLAAGMARGHTLDTKGYDVELGWKEHFEQTITAVAATTTVPRSVWRASRRGAEGEAWWWVNGPKFLRAYLDARPDEPTSNLLAHGGVTHESAIELDLTVDVPTPYGPIPFTAKLDRVTNAKQPGPDSPESNWITLVVRDYKTSYERPTDTTQLGDYAWALRLWGVPDSVRILGSYFDARRGTWTEPVDLLQAHPFEAFQYRVTTAHAQKRALTTGPTPARPSSFCGGCSVRYACPVMAAKS
jgi:hypothetical protein